MEAIEKLLTRKSHGKLIEPGPTERQLNQLLQVALRAPDHAQLRPWRYRVYSGSSLEELGNYFAEAAKIEDPQISQDKLQRIKNKPLRAPMVLVASVAVVEHKKVPEIEQILSAGASVQNLLMAAHLLNLGAMWRTGNLAFNRHLMDLLNMEKNESIVGFVYLGTEEGNKKPVPQLDIKDFVSWH